MEKSITQVPSKHFMLISELIEHSHYEKESTTTEYMGIPTPILITEALVPILTGAHHTSVAGDIALTAHTEKMDGLSDLNFSII